MKATVTADAGAEVEVGGVLLLAPSLMLLVVAMGIGVAVAGGLASSVSGSVLMLLLVSVPAYASLSMWGQLSSPRRAQKPVRNSRVMPSPACRFV